MRERPNTTKTTKIDVNVSTRGKETKNIQSEETLQSPAKTPISAS